MISYKVIASLDAQNDLDNFIYYILTEKLNEQAAIALLDDYDETVAELSKIAGSLKPLEDDELKEYRKIRLRRHNYYLLYRIEGYVAIIDRMFHDLQDLDGVMKSNID